MGLHSFSSHRPLESAPSKSIEDHPDSGRSATDLLLEYFPRIFQERTNERDATTKKTTERSLLRLHCSTRLLLSLSVYSICPHQSRNSESNRLAVARHSASGLSRRDREEELSLNLAPDIFEIEPWSRADVQAPNSLNERITEI